MANRRRNLYLILTLACFFGLIAVFMVKGYMGVYDTIYIGAGEREQVIAPETWLTPARAWQQVSSRGEEKVSFRYEVSNRRFSYYSAPVAVSLWQNREKVLDVLSEQIVVAPFGTEVVEWELEPARLSPTGAVPEQGYEYSVIVNRGEVERKIVGHVGYYGPVKIPPPPAR